VKSSSNRAWFRWLGGAAVAVSLFLGFWSFAYQGYTEDAGSTPVQSWPYGVVFYAAAGLLLVLMIRRARPGLPPAKLALIAAAVAAVLFVAALGSLDAGGNSFEF
jgi:drug/metabolite transporter (DMT)-like permease